MNIYENDYSRSSRIITKVITFYSSWSNLASSHYSKQVQDFLMVDQINFVQRQQKPPNVPQARPIETIWSLLKQVYDGAWEAKNLSQLARKIRRIS